MNVGFYTYFQQPKNHKVDGKAPLDWINSYEQDILFRRKNLLNIFYILIIKIIIIINTMFNQFIQRTSSIKVKTFLSTSLIWIRANTALRADYICNRANKNCLIRKSISGFRLLNSDEVVSRSSEILMCICQGPQSCLLVLNLDETVQIIPKKKWIFPRRMLQNTHYDMKAYKRTRMYFTECKIKKGFNNYYEITNGS